MLRRFSDIHTHCPGHADAILSVAPDAVGAVDDGQCYSLQLHPWHLPHDVDGARCVVDAFCTAARRLAASDARLVAIGECGLDGLCDVPVAIQREAFVAALTVARELRLPVVIHCVRLWGDMMADVRRVMGQRPLHDPPVIVHGYRRGPALARQLLDAGFCLSLGPHFQPDVAAMLPPSRCYQESDAQ